MKGRSSWPSCYLDLPQRKSRCKGSIAINISRQLHSPACIEIVSKGSKSHPARRRESPSPPRLVKYIAGHRWRCKKRKGAAQECESEKRDSGRHRCPTIRSSCPRIWCFESRSHGEDISPHILSTSTIFFPREPSPITYTRARGRRRGGVHNEAWISVFHAQPLVQA